MNSVLNPEAPEFYPHLTSVTQSGYTKVNKTIRSSNQLPAGASYELFKTYTDFNIVTCQFSQNIVSQSNRILVTELPAVKLKCFENEDNTEKIADANELVLDRASVNVAAAAGAHRPNARFLDGMRASAAPAAWNQAPVIAKIQMGSTMFIGAKNIPRPQLMFKEAVDNSASLWVPKISDKPNNIKPLALNILYNDAGEAYGYEHPYKVELGQYQPPAQFLKGGEEPSFPPPLEETMLTLVDTLPALERLLDHLAAVDELAVDLEHHSYRTYQGITCLIQLTTDDGGDFLVDALALREHLHKLNQVFTDPKKLKVFHGAESDVLWLQRDFGVYVVGMADTHRAARALHLPSLSLKHLLHHYCGVDADKKFQLADWRIRPLPAELVAYARSDTHYLLYVWRRMRIELEAQAPALVQAVFDQSRHICMQTYNKQVVDEQAHLPLYVRSRKAFNTRQLAALRLLYKWRDQNARELDESPTYLVPNHMLVALAESLPRDVQGVAACCSPTPPFVKQQLFAIHRMLLSCRELPLEPQLLAPAGAPAVGAQPLAPTPVHDLSAIPDHSEELIDLDKCWELARGPAGTLAAAAAAAAAASDVPVLAGPSESPLVSELNADAKLFIPPYDRYRKYRTLAQIEEIKEYKDKEAKIAALGKGDELIKSEVLAKMQQAKSQFECYEGKEAEAPPPSAALPPTPAPPTARELLSTAAAHALAATAAAMKTQRKRKRSAPTAALYKNINYRKFFDDTEKARRQPKMKFKKHK